jgi:hypothetical protein
VKEYGELSGQPERWDPVWDLVPPVLPVVEGFAKSAGDVSCYWAAGGLSERCVAHFAQSQSTKRVLRTRPPLRVVSVNTSQAFCQASTMPQAGLA